MSNTRTHTHTFSQTIITESLLFFQSEASGDTSKPIKVGWQLGNRNASIDYGIIEKSQE